VHHTQPLKHRRLPKEFIRLYHDIFDSISERRTDDSNSNRQIRKRTTTSSQFSPLSTLITAALTMTTKIPTATLYALVRAYVEARNTNSHIVLFASTKALPDPVKEIIKTFVQRYYMEGLRFSHDGKELTPNDITVDGGSLLATYIHSLGSYTVMLASMCQHILKDDYLKKDFVAELPPGVELSQRAWSDQKSAIKNVVSNYIMAHIICPLHEGKPHHIKTSFVALKDHFSPQFVACFLSLRSRELD
jgi:hypothetical protein